MKRAFKLLAGFLVVLLVTLVVNHVITTRETKPAQADIGRIVKLRGGDIQVREDGPRRAPALVLLHCFDCSMHWWRPSVRALARRQRVIRVDLLGHGGSAKPREGYSMENQARLVAGVLDRLRVRRAVVAGHSMGGGVALALAEQRPRLVSGVILVDKAPTADPGKDLSLTARLGFYPLIGPALRRMATDSRIYDGLALAFAPGYRFPRSLVNDYRRMTYTSYDQSGELSARYAQQTPLDHRLSALRKPALVLYGDRDQLIDVPAAMRSFRIVPRARVYIIRGAGHSPAFERPQPTTRLMLRFARFVQAGERPARGAPARRR